MAEAPVRIEGPEKVTGRARYTYDVRLPGMLYARVLRSRHPHARIRRIDTAAAETLPGVHAVISSATIANIAWYETSSIFDSTVRFIGDEVAAVAAETEEIAEDGLRLIEVDYEVLPFVTDLDLAHQDDAPKLHDYGNVPAEPKVYERGDTGAALANAEVVVDETYATQSALQNAFETHGATAHWEGDHLTLYTSTQSVFRVREMVAEALGKREDQVRVVMQHMGGGFGAKQVAWKHDVIAALLARQSGRPVQLMLDREAENLAVGNRNATSQHVRLAARRDGTLTAIEADIRVNIGAYKVGGEGSAVAGIYGSLYRCANVKTTQVAIHTNTGPAVAFRAPGFVEGAFGLETAMDELARRLDMDPLQLRLRNYTDIDQTAGKPYTTDGLRSCYTAASEAFGWRDAAPAQASAGVRRGRGMAANIWHAGSGWPPAYAWTRLNGDGTADVITGTQDIGTGTRTGLAMIAAEELALPLDRVSLHLGDTERGPYSPVSAGSATQASLGPAIKDSIREVKQRLLEAAARELEVDIDRLSINGRFIEVSDEGEAISIEELCGRIAPEMIQGFGSRAPNPPDKSVKTFSAQFAEVEVNLETGEVTVRRLVTANDCGRIINPVLVDSQVFGGVVQGTGFALTEERVVDNGLGVVLNPNLEEYKLPTVQDAPKVGHARVDLPDWEANSTGAKGIGEPPLISTAPAITNAIFDAIGVRFRSLPVSPWTVLNHLYGHGRSGGAT
jgi:xanthine dehydrogenase YagR molybdenum-binding subunit